MVLEAALGHVLVDQEAVLLLAAVAHELHQVGVAELAQEDDLRQPLVSLRALGVSELDGDLLRPEPRLGALADGALVTIVMERNHEVQYHSICLHIL